jgi:hypothetical protein
METYADVNFVFLMWVHVEILKRADDKILCKA